ncbi:MAG: sensor histidine kinase [Thermoleophilaceae bacterium]|nr:sensor histidine kinase [Thermoleophilaceae bacterium]
MVAKAKPAVAPSDAPRSTLHGQIVASNALIITTLIFVDVVFLRGGRTTTSIRDALVLVMVAIAASLMLNILMLSRQFRPFDKLVRAMETIDLSHPDARVVAPGSATADVAELFDSFNAMIDRLQRERRRRAGASVRAQEAERARVARDLHDEANQALTAVLLRLEAAALNATPEVAAEIREAKQLAGQAIEELLEVSRKLRPTVLDLGLKNSLKALTDGVESDAGVRVDLVIDGNPKRLSEDVELAIYRVAQESLSNVLQHSGASSISVKLTCSNSIVLEVADNGCGFDPDHPTNRYGVTGMRERAILAGGSLKFYSEPGKGTTVRLEIPATSQRGANQMSIAA